MALFYHKIPRPYWPVTIEEYPISRISKSIHHRAHGEHGDFPSVFLCGLRDVYLAFFQASAQNARDLCVE